MSKKATDLKHKWLESERKIIWIVLLIGYLLFSGWLIVMFLKMFTIEHKYMVKIDRMGIAEGLGMSI